MLRKIIELAKAGSVESGLGNDLLKRSPFSLCILGISQANKACFTISMNCSRAGILAAEYFDLNLESAYW